MTFEEFFKKKRISLDLLKIAEPGLYAEFKAHFEKMGEKSFDHTKKYWFNKLRLKFPAPVEEKTEKVKLDNPLAEQTITESLDEQTVPASKLGFTPKFRAANVPKPAERPTEETPAEETTAPAPKLGFTPKFIGANPAAGPVSVKSIEERSTEETPAPVPTPKLGFTPKFKAANPPKPANPPTEEEKSAQGPQTKPPPADDAPKPAYKPRFNMKNLPKKDE